MSRRDERVSVYWWDACHHMEFSGNREEALRLSGLAMSTEGWLLSYDDDGITIANERCVDPDGGEVTYRDVTYVPAGVIREVWVLEKAKLLKEK